MNKPISSLEITSSGIKLVVGYVYNHQVYILHALESTRSHLTNGQIADAQEMVIAIKELVSSASKTLNIDIDSVVLGLPSTGLSIIQKRAETTTTDRENHVKDFDGSNLLSMVTKQCTSPDSKMALLDIVPYQFIMDKNTTSVSFPRGSISSSLSMCADVELINELVLQNLVHIVNEAGLAVEKTVNVTNAAIKLIFSYEDSLTEFIYIDIGASMTTFGAAYNSRLSNAMTVNFGSNTITEALMKRFNITQERANYFKETFGLSQDPKFDFTTSEGIKLSEISACIQEAMTPFVDHLQTFEMSVEANFRNLLIVSGGGADLYGMDSFLYNHFHSRALIFNPVNFGARNNAYTNCVAMIKYFSEYEIKTASNRPIDLTLTRVDNILTKDSNQNGARSEEVKPIGDEEL